MNLIERCVPLLVEKLEATIKNPGLTVEDQTAVADSQGLMCGALLIATQRLRGPGGSTKLCTASRMYLITSCLLLLFFLTFSSIGIIAYADRMMQCYHLVLCQGRSASVSEEVLMAIGSIADALESGFRKYVEAVMPYLITGLRSWEQYQVSN